MLMWLIDAAVKRGYSNEVITQYLLVIEFTAMHTTAMVRDVNYRIGLALTLYR